MKTEGEAKTESFGIRVDFIWTIGPMEMVPMGANFLEMGLRGTSDDASQTF